MARVGRSRQSRRQNSCTVLEQARAAAGRPCSGNGGEVPVRHSGLGQGLSAQAKGAAVIGVNVTFEYDGDLDRDRVINVAEKARAMFEGMPELRFKFFTFDEKG